MAKRFVLDALVKVLGEFIDINEENLNLSLAVWSGRIILNNLKLKTDKLSKSFNLSIYHGLIHQLEVIIPWTALFNSPVKVLIDGVYLQVGPLPARNKNNQDRRKHSLERKREKLRLSDKFLDYSAIDGSESSQQGSKSGKSESYIQQLSTKIIDNLEITLKNVHIRYEDSKSIPNRIISAGITLSSFILATCDENWKVTFVARSASTSKSLHKIAEAKGVAIYWNTVSESYMALSFDDWVIAMNKSIAVENMPNAIRGLRYILAPKNNITIKMTHRDTFSETLPKMKIIFECSNLPITIDMTQYLQAKRVINKVMYEDRGYERYSISYRPKQRPTASAADARAWWRYACKVIIRKPKYINLVKLIKLHDKSPPSTSTEPSSSSFLSTSHEPLTPRQCQELEHLEEQIPTHALVLFRLIAFKEAAEYKRQQVALLSPTSRSNQPPPLPPSSTTSGGWSGWFNSSSSSKDANLDSVSIEDDVPIDKILEEFHEDKIASHEVSSSSGDNQTSSNSLLALLQLNSSASFELLYENKSVIRAAMSLNANSRITSVGVVAQVDLVDFIVEDKFTPSPALRNLVSVKHRLRNHRHSIDHVTVVDRENDNNNHSINKASSLSLKVEYYRGKLKAKVTTLPFIFCLNKDCVQMLLAMYFYNPPPLSSSSHDESAIEQDQLAKNVQDLMKKPASFSKSSSLSLSPQHSDFEIIFEAHAPKIIVPEYSSSDAGYLLLDTGYLEVKGFTGKDGMSWNVTLRDVNVAMPLSVKDLYSFDEKSLYLIKPFDIKITVQTIIKTTADMAIGIDIQPEVRGELDPRKLARLFHIIQAVYLTFQDLPVLNIETFILNESTSSSSLANLASLTFDDNEVDDEEDEDDGLMYGTPRASPIEFLESSSTTGGLKSTALQSTPDPSRKKKSFITPSISVDRLSDYSEPSSKSDSIKVIDPTHIRMQITCNLPRVVLDLTYNAIQGNHLVLTLTNTATVVVTRPYDMMVSFTLNELAIEDSLRSENQRYLAKTPENSQLINITYTNSSSSLSPYYKKHATEVVVNFASLGLNCDVKTISHLKPFIEILVHLRSGNQVILRTNQSKELSSDDVSGPNISTSLADQRPNINLSSIAAALSTMQKRMSLGNDGNTTPVVPDRVGTNVATIPIGMLILLTMDQISLDILRPSINDQVGTFLDNAFSLQVSNLRAVIDMKEFLASDVKLKSFIIFDSRELSKDYAYRTIFCPIFDCNDVHHDNDNQAAALLPPRSVDLLQLVYKQESTASAFMDVIVSNTTSFVAVDTILDLAYVLMENFFAVLDLLANPGPEQLSLRLQEYLIHYRPPHNPSTSSAPHQVISETSPKSSALPISTDDYEKCHTYTLNISVHVENPRLIILDDPTSEESQAIVGRCEVEVHFTRETRTYSNKSISIIEMKDLHESLHLSVKRLELFVVESILNINDFKPILEPFGIEYHVRRRLRNGVSISTHMSTDLDGIEARISIRDILLLQSILTRRFLKSSTSSSDDDDNQSSTQLPTPIQTNAIISEVVSPIIADASSPEKSNNFSISITTGTISIIAIDDYDGKNIPFLHSTLQETSFYAEGNLPIKVHGEGSFVCQTDFYNSKLDSWEPVLEQWKPVITASVDNGNTLIELKSAHTMQMTLSGCLLHQLCETYLLLFNRGKSKSLAATLHESIANVVITNCLGEGVDVDLLDSKSGNRVLMLTGAGDASRGLIWKNKEFLDRKCRREDWVNPSGLPASVDLHFHGSLEGKRKPVIHVPFNISKPRLCNLIPMDLGQHVNDISSKHHKSKRIIILEPIVEETYENARYEPIAGIWRKPYLFGDPEEWTDATLINSRHPQTITVKDELWEWQDSWTVDMVGIIGKDFDDEGWEYSNSFKSFSIASKRRSNMPMDCVRRRRWIRTRVPKISIDSEISRPLNIFWDVKVDNTGNREVKIRSGLLIVNSMPFAIEILLYHKVWEAEEVIYGPIKPSEVFFIPLLRSFATTMKMRPAKESESIQLYDWSHTVPCTVQQFDFLTIKDIYCEAYPIPNNPGKQLSAVVMRVVLNQVNKCLTIDLQPYITITNVLPCDLKYRVSSSDRRKESGILLCGASGKLIHVDTSLVPVISLKLGNYNWSQPCSVYLPDDHKTTILTVELSRKASPNAVSSHNTAWIARDDKMKTSSEDESSRLVVSITIKANQGCRYEFTIFSRSAVIDRTGLDLSIWCNINKSTATTIKTYYTNDTSSDRFISSSTSNDNLNNRTIRSLDEHDKYHDSEPLATLARNDSDDRIAEYGKSAADFGDNYVRMYRSVWGMNDHTTARDINRVVYEMNTSDNSNIAIIKDLTVKSNHSYIVSTLSDGGEVYTDCKLRWSYLPPLMRRGNSITIRTSSEDAKSRYKDMMKFRLITPSIVFILIDRAVSKCPKWIEEAGYERIIDQAVARRVENGKLNEIYYAIFGRYYDLVNSGEEWISLHGNWNKEKGRMYSVIITPDPRHYHYHSNPMFSQPTQQHEPSSQQIEHEFLKILEQILFNMKYDRVIAGKSWVEGGYGLGLFHSHNDIVSVGILKDQIYSTGININTNNGAPAQGYFEIVDWSSNKEYQLSYRIERMPGLFHHTQMMTVMSRYCIVNCMDEPIYIAQRGASAMHKGFQVKPYHVEPWHKTDTSASNILHFRTHSTAWSLGVVDINEVGSSILMLPRRSAMIKKVPSSLSSSDASNVVIRPPAAIEQSHKEPYVIHVEVKEADYSENCSAVIIVWRASVQGHNAELSVKNDSDVPITIAQSDIHYDVEGYDASLFEIIVAPNQWIPFGWADPDIGSNISIVVGESLRGHNSRRVATVSFLKTGELLRLPDHTQRLGNNGEVLISIITHGSGRILRIARMSSTRGYTRVESNQEDESLTYLADKLSTTSSFDFHVHLSSYGLSLILDKPIRREFMSLYLDGLDVSLKKNGTIRSLEVNVMDMQIDNYSESKIYPVLLRSKKKEIHRSIAMNEESGYNTTNDDINGTSSTVDIQTPTEIPLIVVSIIQEFSVGSTPIFRYVAFRMLPVYLEVDSATIQILLADLVNDFKLLSTSQILATINPAAWVEDFNKSLLSPRERHLLIDMYSSQLVSQSSKIYFQKLVVHPVKLFVTIIPTPDYNHDIDQETIQSTFSNVFKSFAAIDRVQLKLRSFEVEDAMETKTSLLYLILAQFRQDISSHFGQLFGSLAVIGSPMGFARKVGRGVKAFFYEPYLGLVQSPQDFVLGIGKGTSRLVSGVVSGAMNSTVAIVGTAAKGISYLSGDSEYTRKRAIKREMHRSNRRGIVDGLFDGGESLLSGLASGVTGLVTRPLQEARRDGAVGFFRGIGLGLVGAAIKPVMGFTDGIASVANGISNSVGDNLDCEHVRPARAFDRSSSDTSDMIIRPLRLDAAFAQDFVLLRAKHNSYHDAFLTYIPMACESPGSAVILSEVYVYWRKTKSLWGRTWSNISHVVCFPNEVGILMYGAVGKNKPESFSIPCGGNRAKVLEVYVAFANNAHRMGNPTLVIPVDLVEQYGLNDPNNPIDLRKIARRGHATNLAGEIDGYLFGQANSIQFPRITGPELDVLRRCEHYLRLVYPSVKVLDERLWRLIWEWECTHTGLTASRCCLTLIMNRSDTPIQIGKIQIIHGRNVLILGSEATGYEEESRCIQPDGSVVIFAWAFSPTPIEVGHLKAVINTAEFVVTVASTQRESSCVSQGGLSVAFLEKSVAEWWSKYIVLVEN